MAVRQKAHMAGTCQLCALLRDNCVAKRQNKSNIMLSSLNFLELHTSNDQLEGLWEGTSA
eukprot:5962195-Amphidinium_carterae.2